MLLDQKENAVSYNQNPAYHEDKFRKHFEEYALPDVQRFVSELKGPKVLDAGCGPGIYLEYFREQGVEALGIDLSEGFLERCIQKGLNVRKMDMEQPLLYPYSYDGIWAHAAIMHIPRSRVPQLVQTWAKLLKPNGLLFVSAKEGVDEGFEPAENGDNTKRWFTYFSEEELIKLFSAKFDVIHHYQQTTGSRVWVKCLFRLKPATKPLFQNR